MKAKTSKHAFTKRHNYFRNKTHAGLRKFIGGKFTKKVAPFVGKAPTKKVAPLVPTKKVAPLVATKKVAPLVPTKKVAPLVPTPQMARLGTSPTKKVAPLVPTPQMAPLGTSPTKKVKLNTNDILINDKFTEIASIVEQTHVLVLKYNVDVIDVRDEQLKTLKLFGTFYLT